MGARDPQMAAMLQNPQARAMLTNPDFLRTVSNPQNLQVFIFSYSINNNVYVIIITICDKLYYYFY